MLYTRMCILYVHVYSSYNICVYVHYMYYMCVYVYMSVCMCTPRHICLGLVLPTVDWALMHHLPFRKCPTYLSTSQCDVVSPSVEVPSFLVTALCLFDKT